MVLRTKHKHTFFALDDGVVVSGGCSLFFFELFADVVHVGVVSNDQGTGRSWGGGWRVLRRGERKLVGEMGRILRVVLGELLIRDGLGKYLFVLVVTGRSGAAGFVIDENARVEARASEDWLRTGDGGGRRT